MNARRNPPALPKAMPAPSDSPVLINEGLLSDKDFAAWAPAENSGRVSSYLENLYRLLQIERPC